MGTLGNLSVTGNANIGNVNSAGIVTATGNVIGGNILTAGLISATGNITGNYFLGNGSQLTGIVASSATSLVNGTTNITTALNGNANVTIAGTSNVVVWATTGEYVTGNVYSTNTIFVPYGVSQAPTDLTLISLTNALIA